MFIAEAPRPRTKLRQERHVGLGSRRGSMPLLTELAEIVVGSGSYKHAAPTELGEPCSPCGYKHAAPDGAVGGRPVCHSSVRSDMFIAEAHPPPESQARRPPQRQVRLPHSLHFITHPVQFALENPGFPQPHVWLGWQKPRWTVDSSVSSGGEYDGAAHHRTGHEPPGGGTSNDLCRSRRTSGKRSAAQCHHPAVELKNAVSPGTAR